MLAGSDHDGPQVGDVALLPAHDLFIELRSSGIPENIAHIFDAELLQFHSDR
jgi:hypothetical protein